MEEDTEVKVEIGGPEPEVPELPEMPMPYFSAMLGPFRFLSWIPFIITAVAVFIVVSLVQLIYNIIMQPDAPITWGAVFAMFLISLAIALLFHCSSASSSIFSSLV